jgi:hypothetical protein
MKLTKVQKEFGKYASKGGQAVARRLKTDPSYRNAVKKRMTGENNPAKRLEVQEAISKGLKRSWRNKEHRRKRELGMQRNWDKNWERRVAEMFTPEYSAKMAKVMKGRDPIGRPRGPRTVWYVGQKGRVAMKSKDEVRYAKLLDKTGVAWLYECTTFTVGKRTWTPDFYLPEQQKFVEIKGWLLDWVKRKIMLVFRHYASTRFEMLNSSTLAASPP